MQIHKPVLLNEVINYLNIKEDGIYIDCTLGTGGHSIEILKHLSGQGTLIGIERDLDSLEIAKKRLNEFNDKNYYLFHSNFTELKSILKSLNINKITGGILLDLGVSSLQLDISERGFSFKGNAPLDMRMDKTAELTAFEVVNKYKEEKLANIIYNFGEERYSRKIAREIVQNRVRNGPIKSTKELAELVSYCYPKKRHYKIHPATRTFQALRIEVNKELENIENLLCFIPELLLPQSRLTVISFHSLEDRLIKNFLKNSSEFKALTKKPITPSKSEIDENPRSRSAKLRAGEKI